MKQEEILLKAIEANPKNPRGIKIAEEDEKLSLLKTSIQKFGILVPLAVLKQGSKYKLIDGERRYEAAKSLGLKEVPAIITTDVIDEDNFLLRMFHIHHNREQWGPVQQCRALEGLYEEIINQGNIKKIKDEDIKLREITEELVAHTGMEARTALNRVYFLRWPKEIKKKFYDKPSTEYWYICEIEQGIIVPALKNYPEYFNSVSVNEVRKDFFEKAEHKSVNAGTEVRQVAPYIRFQTVNQKERTKVLKLLDVLRNNKDMTYEEGKHEFEASFPDWVDSSETLSLRKISNMMNKLVMALETFQFKSLGKSKEEKKGLLKMIDRLEEKLLQFKEVVSKD